MGVPGILLQMRIFKWEIGGRNPAFFIMNYIKEILVGSIIGLVSFLFNYLVLFLKMKFDVDNIKSIIKEMKISHNNEKNQIYERFSDIEKKIDDNTKLIIQTIMEKNK